MTKLTYEEKVMKMVLLQHKLSDGIMKPKQWELRRVFLMQQHLFDRLGVDEANRLMGEARKTLALLGDEPKKLIPISQGRVHNDIFTRSTFVKF